MFSLVYCISSNEFPLPVLTSGYGVKDNLHTLLQLTNYSYYVYARDNSAYIFLLQPCSPNYKSRGCHPSACSVEPIEPGRVLIWRFHEVDKDHQINKLPVYMCMCTCCIVGNFRGIPFSQIVNLFCFTDLIFAGARTPRSCPLCTVQLILFCKGLIFVVR